jgi:hypothetical protein
MAWYLVKSRDNFILPYFNLSNTNIKMAYPKYSTRHTFREPPDGSSVAAFERPSFSFSIKPLTTVDMELLVEPDISSSSSSTDVA